MAARLTKLDLNNPQDFRTKLMLCWCLVQMHNIWHKPNTAYQYKHLMPTVKHSGGGVMIWACFDLKLEKLVYFHFHTPST